MKVKIKTWEKMEKEFGLDSFGSIDCARAFVDIMENLLPNDRIIEVSGLSKHWRVGRYKWTISDDMIEEYL